MFFDISCLYIVSENIEGNKNFGSDAEIIKIFAYSCIVPLCIVPKENRFAYKILNLITIHCRS